MNEAAEPDAVLDITGESCPMTFVRTRLALDALRSGQILDVYLRGDEPLRNVPRMGAALGHAVLALDRDEAGTSRLRLRKA